MTILIAAIVFSSVLLLPNRDIIIKFLSSDSVTLWFKLSFVFNMYGSVVMNYGILSIVYMVSVAILFGINISLLTYYVRRRQSGSVAKKASAASLAGLVSGVLGIGCAACGSIILTAVLGLFGATGLLLLLPLHGAEFGFLGILLLIFSIYSLLKRINDPLVCPS